MTTIHTLDLQFMGHRTAIAAYAIPHSGGVVLVECGPGSTLTRLESALADLGFRVEDVSDVLLTHIHLDHAGAAGALARRGARIHVHTAGAGHLLNPEKLLNSASRIYGEQMGPMWGEFLPVPEANLNIPKDGETLNIHGLEFTALETPGHAIHHFAYVFEDVCFSGDVGGIRLPGVRHLRLPLPPPDINLDAWRQSLDKLRQARFSRIAPTHFGMFDDPAWHLEALRNALDLTDAWLETVMPADPEVDEINRRFIAWTAERAAADGLSADLHQVYEAANPSWMSAAGMQRYWKKFRA